MEDSKGGSRHLCRRSSSQSGESFSTPSLVSSAAAAQCLLSPSHQFLDPLLLASEVRRGSGRRVAFLIAEKSIKRRFIGTAARLMQSSECPRLPHHCCWLAESSMHDHALTGSFPSTTTVPVARAADNAKPGKGLISAHPSGDPLLLQGHGTSFTTQLVPRGQIVLPKAAHYASVEVVEVISDTEVRIKKEFKESRAVAALRGELGEDAKGGAHNGNGKGDGNGNGKEKGSDGEEKEGAGNVKGCKYQCLPFVDQTEMYASVYERLAEGGCLGIFPEGECLLRHFFARFFCRTRGASAASSASETASSLRAWQK